MPILKLKTGAVYCQKLQVFLEFNTVCRMFLFIYLFFDSLISWV